MTSAFNLFAKFALVPRPSTPFDLASERKLRSGHLFSSFSMSGCGSGSVGSGSGKRGNLNINCSIGGPVQLDQVPASALLLRRWCWLNQSNCTVRELYCQRISENFNLSWINVVEHHQGCISLAKRRLDSLFDRK